MEQKAWIDVKSPRFFYLEGYPIYWGDGIWCETFDLQRICKNYSPSKPVISKLTIRKAMAAFAET